MKILHLGVRNMAPGGIRTYVQTVMAGQKARGHDPILVEIDPEPGHDDILDRSLANASQLKDCLASLAPHVVHLHSPLADYSPVGRRAVQTCHEHSAYCPAGSKLLTRTGRRCDHPFGVVHCLVHHYLDQCGSRHPANLARAIRLTQGADKFRGIWIAPSTYTRHMLVQRGFQETRIQFLSNPGPMMVQDSLPPPGPDAPFLFMGRLVREKGCETLLRAMVHLEEGARLAILGDGPDRPRLQSLAEELGVANRVRFEGWMAREQVAAHLEACRALVVPSWWPEPFGLVALEAFARSRPVIASRIGGLQDIVLDGQTGYLVAPGSPTDLAEAMAKLRSDSIHAAAMGHKGARDLEARFSLDMHLAGLEQTYQRALHAVG